jgi:hypothetical protein
MLKQLFIVSRYRALYVFSKLRESENDCHKLIQQQRELHNRRLGLLQRH